MAQIKLIVYPTKDVATSKKIFNEFLGVEPYMDSPYYVGYKVGDQEVGLDPNAFKQNINTPIAYIDVKDIKASIKTLLDAGGQLLQDAQDVGQGLLIAKIKDQNGNILGLRQSP